VEMTQVQAAYLGSGNAGNGTLRYRGHTYPFSVGGLGVGGSASRRSRRGARSTAWSASATSRALTFRVVMASLGTVSTGDLWLENGNGVIMRLVAKRQGLMLSLGGNAVVIQMNQ
jgi:hypothetical protein